MELKLRELAKIAIPKGAAVTWTGTSNDVPKGWEICINTKEYIYQSDFDTNGIIYDLGTNDENKEWQNPYQLGLVELKSTGMFHDSKPIDNLIGRVSGVRCLLDAKENAWWSIHFKHIKIKPNKYTLRHYTSCDVHALRHWKLEGSENGQQWITLRTHRNDASLDKKDATHTWNIDNCNQFFTYFRIYMTGKDSGGHWYLCCSGFEIYGIVISNRMLIKNIAVLGSKSCFFINIL